MVDEQMLLESTTAGCFKLRLVVSSGIPHIYIHLVATSTSQQGQFINGLLLLASTKAYIRWQSLAIFRNIISESYSLRDTLIPYLAINGLSFPKFKAVDLFGNRNREYITCRQRGY